MELRTCKSCEVPKPVADFYMRGPKPQGACKRCISEANRRARKARAKPKVDLVGQRFGDLVVLAKVPPCLAESVGLERKRGTGWLCVCACGQATYLQTDKLISGNTKSCGCGKYSGSPENVKKAQAAVRIPDRLEAAANRIRHTYLHGAKVRGISYALQDSLFVRLIYSDCHYCGSPPTNTLDLKHRAYRKDPGDSDIVHYNGIDRIDSAKGYEEGNVVPCCKLCNTGKMSLTLPEFQDWIRRVYARLPA